ncbi:hypothetical protein [Amycolatopsis sp. NPDC057786]|uniref:hypothetical protein n=1 Tax=Amycolatopsis sp. NPDC057786 TaxID=3346250 RepID=UPI0036710B2D
MVAWFAGIPLAKGARAWRRRRQPDIGAVLGACREAKDLLCKQRVSCTAGTTVRDLAAAAHGTVDQSTVDVALWSGVGTGGHTPACRRGQRCGQCGAALPGVDCARLRTAVNPRTLSSAQS